MADRVRSAAPPAFVRSAATPSGAMHRLRAEFLEGRSFASLAEAQAALDAWITHYNCRRLHQGIGTVAPLRRFAAGEPRSVAALPAVQLAPSRPAPEAARGAVTRLVGATAKISYCGWEYRVGAYLTAERVEVEVAGGLVEVRHRGVLVAQAAARYRPGAVPTRGRQPQLRANTAGRAVLRMVDQRLSFAGAIYRVGNRYCGQQVEVRLVGDTVEISLAGELIRSHTAKHDPVKEHGAFATPVGRPRRCKASRDEIAV